LGLRCGDVNLDASAATVRGNDDGGWGKVADSRQVALSPQVADAIKAHLEQFAVVDEGALLFPDPDAAQPMPLPTTVLVEQFRLATRLAGLPGTSFHRLRHTNRPLRSRHHPASQREG